MKLLVDIGNSRVKWARLDARGALGDQRAAAHAGWTVAEWRASLLDGAPPDAVLVASVAAVETDAALVSAVRLATGREAQFITTARQALGVRNGYADPRLLGVDRWVAAIGAYRRTRTACVVADVGTAATVDVVEPDGRHRGGYIVPGPTLMVASLLRSTSDLQSHSAWSGEGGRGGEGAAFADNTREAIDRGCRLAVAALIDRSVDDAIRACGAVPRLLVTGGAAGAVLPYLRTAAEHLPELVLLGLAEFALAGASAPGNCG